VALDFYDLVVRYSFDQDEIGIMSSGVVRDEKRTQPELGILAMKKTIEYRVSYYQSRANSVANQLIEKARINAFTFNDYILPPTNFGPGLDFELAANSQYTPVVSGF